MTGETLRSNCPTTFSLLPGEYLSLDISMLPDVIKADSKLLERAPYLYDLAQIELLAYRLRLDPPPLPGRIDSWQLRPGVELLEVNWVGLPEKIAGQEIVPVRQDSYVLFVPHADSSPTTIITPDNYTLLALKIVVEELDLAELARDNGVSVGHLENVLQRASDIGLILRPRSKLVRPVHFCPNSPATANLAAQVFTLQWHITQSCDLHCRHCYDRSVRSDVSLRQGEEILDQFHDFCRKNNVFGQVSFSGGNPFMHPHFFELYRHARDRGFMTAILGNPVSRDEVEELLSIGEPEFYQVSLEGLQPHNDYMRGKGHYCRTLQFLDLLKARKIFSMVMLTLTSDNRDQVIPLAETLRDRTDLFTFNRLAMVGQGAVLTSVAIKEYRTFLERYLEAAKRNPIMRLKDNLFNILHLENGGVTGGGCAGHGCGAAFNFFSLLPDGQVHACRKFPSLIGNVSCSSLTEIYWSRAARKYRNGCTGCRDCRIRHVCGGCPAVTFGFGKDIFNEVDPYCFLGQ